MTEKEKSLIQQHREADRVADVTATKWQFATETHGGTTTIFVHWPHFAEDGETLQHTIHPIHDGRTFPSKEEAREYAHKVGILRRYEPGDYTQAELPEYTEINYPDYYKAGMSIDSEGITLRWNDENDTPKLAVINGVTLGMLKDYIRNLPDDDE